jgi:hypothetical protein
MGFLVAEVECQKVLAWMQAMEEVEQAVEVQAGGTQKAEETTELAEEITELAEEITGLRSGLTGDSLFLPIHLDQGRCSGFQRLWLGFCDRG